MELRSEFAEVRVELDTTGNGPRLKILDIRTGMMNFLDPLELESLAWSRHEDLAQILDPSYSRWKDAEEPREDSDDPRLSRMLKDLGWEERENGKQ
jgi:hypothetical protein